MASADIARRRDAEIVVCHAAEASSQHSEAGAGEAHQPRRSWGCASRRPVCLDESRRLRIRRVAPSPHPVKRFHLNGPRPEAAAKERHGLRQARDGLGGHRHADGIAKTGAVEISQRGEDDVARAASGRKAPVSVLDFRQAVERDVGAVKVRNDPRPLVRREHSIGSERTPQPQTATSGYAAGVEMRFYQQLPMHGRLAGRVVVDLERWRSRGSRVRRHEIDCAPGRFGPHERRRRFAGSRIAVPAAQVARAGQKQRNGGWPRRADGRSGGRALFTSGEHPAAPQQTGYLGRAVESYLAGLWLAQELRRAGHSRSAPRGAAARRSRYSDGLSGRTKSSAGNRHRSEAMPRRAGFRCLRGGRHGCFGAGAAPVRNRSTVSGSGTPFALTKDCPPDQRNGMA